MGVKLEVWKQGQFYPELGKKIIELPYPVNPGPSDQQVRIEGFNVQPDRYGNFLKGNYSEDELDAISTYGTVRQVIDLFENLSGEKIKWSWQKKVSDEPLSIRIRNNDINARYLKKQKCIELDYYGPYGNWTYNCRTVDLIAHEVGHAILDSILPHLNEGSPESRGIGEAFCDLTTMFLILNQKDLCEYVISETGGNLKKNNILSLFGLGCGYSGKKQALRSALNNATYDRNKWSPYDYSQVLVGFLYDLLYELLIQIQEKDKNWIDNLYDTGQYWTRIIFEALEQEPDIPSITYIVSKKTNIDNRIIKKHFESRNINQSALL